jgi:hypothetical protein
VITWCCATGGRPPAGHRTAPWSVLDQPSHQQPHGCTGPVQAAGASSPPGEISDGTSAVVTFFWVFWVNWFSYGIGSVLFKTHKYC